MNIDYDMHTGSIRIEGLSKEVAEGPYQGEKLRDWSSKMSNVLTTPDTISTPLSIFEALEI